MFCNTCLNSLENDSWSVMEKKLGVALDIAWMSLANTLVKEDGCTVDLEYSSKVLSVN